MAGTRSFELAEYFFKMFCNPPGLYAKAVKKYVPKKVATAKMPQ